MPLRTEVDLGLGHIVLGEVSAPPWQGAQQPLNSVRFMECDFTIKPFELRISFDRSIG